MAKIQLAKLEKKLNTIRPCVNERILSEQSGRQNITRTRRRSSGESAALTQLVLAKKKKAVENGTFVVKERGKIYFDAY